MDPVVKQDKGMHRELTTPTLLYRTVPSFEPFLVKLDHGTLL